MSEEKKEADSTGLVITIFVILVLIVTAVVILVTVLPGNKETVEDPTAVVLITPPPPPTFELSPTPIPTPTRIVEVDSELPDDVTFAFLTPVEIVGFDPDDPTDGLNTRSEASFDGEVLRKIYAEVDVVPLYGTDVSGEWCMTGMHGSEWILCKFLRPFLLEDCDIAPSISEFISEEGCDLGSGEAG